MGDHGIGGKFGQKRIGALWIVRQAISERYPFNTASTKSRLRRGHLVLRSYFPAYERFNAKVLIERLEGYAEFAKELYGDLLAQVTRSPVVA
ncbi:MAG: hypothetical protein EON54_06960 [Alcaligenaceae bacterium]|nr:MAG: hypothetical protein EON54_06960 [Alcaligenaceae bacterium]